MGPGRELLEPRPFGEQLPGNGTSRSVGAIGSGRRRNLNGFEVLISLKEGSDGHCSIPIVPSPPLRLAPPMTAADIAVSSRPFL